MGRFSVTTGIFKDLGLGAQPFLSRSSFSDMDFQA